MSSLFSLKKEQESLEGLRDSKALEGQQWRRENLQSIRKPLGAMGKKTPLNSPHEIEPLSAHSPHTSGTTTQRSGTTVWAVVLGVALRERKSRHGSAAGVVLPSSQAVLPLSVSGHRELR